ncbi:COG4223 family protein [uncultured Enterovirga sp.]|uniref:COG4223 family protein n=1 Tax=uncultured Enterovirga sp. TaxID=2026352 RepID=UPI0035CB3D85
MAGAAPAGRKPDPIQTSTPEKTPARGAGGLVSAGLIGGLVGAGLSLGAQHYLLPARQDDAVAARVAALESRVAALPTGTTAAGPSPLEPRLAAVESGLRQAAEDARAARAVADAASKQVGEALNRPAAAGASAAPDTSLRDTVAALTRRLDESAEQARGNAAALGQFGTKLDGVDGRLGEAVAKGTEAFQGLQRGVGAVQADVQALKTGTGALDARSAEAEKRLAALSGDLGRVSGDLAKLSPAAVQAGLRVVVSGRLDEALRSGAPLGAVLASLGRLGADEAALAALRPFTDAPAPSSDTLAAEFKPLAERMTAVPQGPAATWWDRVRRVFERVVTVRAVGDGSGSDLPGLVARIEASLARGSLAPAAAAWEQLPNEAKAMSSDWGSRLKTRVAADQAAKSISSAALASLDTATAR